MGRHKDKLTLKFIETLKARGKSNGFIVEDEYPLLKGIYYADLIWRLPSDRTPLFTFEIETKPSIYMLRNAGKYFDTPTQEITKPWYHFIVVLKGEIPIGTRKLLRNQIDRHNAYIFENALNAEQCKHFNRFLEEKARGFRVNEDYIPNDYLTQLLKLIDNYVNLMDRGYEKDAQQLIDKLVFMIKEKIEIWDTASVKAACTELFLKLFEIAYTNDKMEVYDSFGELFEFAYSQGNKMINAILEAFEQILKKAEKYKYAIEISEKASEILLKLAINFLSRDISISEDLMRVVDYATEDWPISELMSRQILFGAYLYRKKDASLDKLLKLTTNCIKCNYTDSFEKGLLLDSINYAKAEQQKYEFEIASYEQAVLIPLLKKEIREDIKGLVSYLEEQVCLHEEISYKFIKSDISQMIMAYQSIEPQIANKIKAKLSHSDYPKELSEAFKRAINSSNLLKSVYKGDFMVTTFAELLKFFESNADLENLGTGITTYGPSWVEFKSKLTPSQKQAVGKVSEKYALSGDGEFELGDQNLIFLVDTLVYLGDNRHNMQKLIDFLKEIEAIASIQNFVTGMEFKLRQT
jgi:hypothetical protein